MKLQSCWLCRSESGSLKAGTRNANNPFQLSGSKSAPVTGDHFSLSSGFLESDGDSNCISSDVLMFDLPGSDKVNFNINELLEFVENQSDPATAGIGASASSISGNGANLFDLNVDSFFSSSGKLKDDDMPFSSIVSDISLARSHFNVKDSAMLPSSSSISELQSSSGNTCTFLYAGNICLQIFLKLEEKLVVSLLLFRVSTVLCIVVVSIYNAMNCIVDCCIHLVAKFCKLYS